VETRKTTFVKIGFDPNAYLLRNGYHYRSGRMRHAGRKNGVNLINPTSYHSKALFKYINDENRRDR